MKLQLCLALAGLSANFADARLANFFSKCNTEAELLSYVLPVILIHECEICERFIPDRKNRSYGACSDAMHTSVKKTCDPMTNFSDCACVFGTSMVAYVPPTLPFELLPGPQRFDHFS